MSGHIGLYNDMLSTNDSVLMTGGRLMLMRQRRALGFVGLCFSLCLGFALCKL